MYYAYKKSTPTHDMHWLYLSKVRAKASSVSVPSKASSFHCHHCLQMACRHPKTCLGLSKLQWRTRVLPRMEESCDRSCAVACGLYSLAVSKTSTTTMVGPPVLSLSGRLVMSASMPMSKDSSVSPRGRVGGTQITNTLLRQWLSSLVLLPYSGLLFN